MRNITIIGLTGIGVFVLVWVLLSRSSVTPPARAPEAKISTPPISAPTPAEPKETPPAAATTPSASTPPVAEQSPSAPANPAAAEPAPAVKTPTPDTAGSSVDEDGASTSSPQNADDEDDSTEENPEAPADDAGRAADLLAEWMARQDTAAADSAEVPPSMTALKTFDQEGSDPEWSGPTEQQIEATLDQWVAALPDDVREHIQVIHVECRETMCQILAADNDPASQNQRAQSSQEWQQAVATLPQQPWWTEFGFVDLSTAVNNDEADGFVLYQTYLRREVKPAE
ncbi:MAG TPA: hypothetical protein VGO25_04280 [Rhodanobacteraceae bacterium]|jgi:hypothetical protein|nr:hypothetical protein [Rhodanobacteraceae bacterium]